MAQPSDILCPRCHRPQRPTARFCQHCGHDMVLNNAGPRYYITRVIKAGGQGAVYQARGDDGRVYAVKEMLDNFVSQAERDGGIARFQAEAATLQRLSHPRIPRVYASFEDENRHYLAMDFVEGEDLEEIVEREGALPEPRVLEWADQICDVLGYLHANGLVYRDMKPSNIMLDRRDGRIKLVDFGIAKVLQPSARGTQIGTPGYAPPEQYQGIATVQSDIYALGATLHHLLTGRDPQAHPPFSFPPARDVNPSVSQRTSDALGRALQMKAEDRFGSLAEFRRALNPPPAPPAPRPQPRPAAQPPQAASSPAPPAVTAAPTAAIAPARPARPVRGSPLGWLLGLALIVLVGLAAAVRAGAIGNPLLTPTPQTLIAQPYTVENMEIIVPGVADEALLRRGFTLAFTQSAQSRFGPQVQVREDTLAYLDGQSPARVGDDPRGSRYRASMQGTILVPQP